MTPATKSPFLHAVEKTLAAAGQIQGVSQIMPVGLQRALADLQEQYANLTNGSKIAFYTEDETNRLDWNVAKSALRQASKDVMAARGMHQEPSWLQPAIQIAEERSRAPAPAAARACATDYRVAYSAAQMSASDGSGFWNTSKGWVCLDEASHLTPGLDEASFLSALRNGSGYADTEIVVASQAMQLEEEYMERTEGLAVGRPC